MCDFTSLEGDGPFLDTNEVLALDSRTLSRNSLLIGDGVQYTGDIAIGAMLSFQVDHIFLLKATDINDGLSEANLARLVLINDGNSTFGVGAGETSLLLLVEHFNFKLLFGLPFGVVFDLDLDNTLSLTGMHCHKLVLHFVV